MWIFRLVLAKTARRPVNRTFQRSTMRSMKLCRVLVVLASFALPLDLGAQVEPQGTTRERVLSQEVTLPPTDRLTSCQNAMGLLYSMDRSQSIAGRFLRMQAKSPRIILHVLVTDASGSDNLWIVESRIGAATVR